MPSVSRLRGVRPGTALPDRVRRPHSAGRSADWHVSSGIAGPVGAAATVVRERLDSWKEIAGYFSRTVRTVQRWEGLGLPVRRHEHIAGSSVYAFRAELDGWWTARTPVATLREPAGHPAQTPGIARIAVLPFPGIASGSDGPYCSERFVDELITALASTPGIVVISRTSLRQFTERRSMPMDRLASLLSATLLVEGWLHQEGTEVVATVRLVDPFDAGRVIWGQHYGCLRTDVSQLQAQVAADIAWQAAHRENGHALPARHPA